MISVILDTNIVISALINPGNASAIIEDYILNEKIRLVLSTPLLSEYHDVVRREKFKRIEGFVQYADILLDRLTELADFYEPEIILQILADDPDNRLLELALTSNANYLITGNTKDFTMEIFQKTAIVNPATFIQLLTTP